MERSADVIVVGAGVVGLSVAAHLAERGSRTLLLEKDCYGAAASGSNLGQLSLTDREPGPEQALVRETFDAYAQADGFSLGYAREGGLFIFRDPATLPAAEEIVAQRRRKGYELEMLYGDGLRRAEPGIEGVPAGAFNPEEGRVDPLAVNTWLLERGLEAGMEYRPRTPVEALETRGRRIEGVRTPHGTIRAGTVVLATGSWTAEFLEPLGIRLPIGYLRGTAMVSQPVAPVLRGPVTDGVFLLPGFSHEPGVLLGGVQQENGSVIIAQANAPGRAYNTGIDAEALCRMASLFVRHFPGMAGLEILRVWSGNTTVTPDGEAFWGYLAPCPGLFVAAAFKGAYSLAPAVGAHTARWLTEGIPPEAAESWDPLRFAGGTGNREGGRDADR